MRPEDWKAVSKIYKEGIATEHATFQTEGPPYSAWDASHIKECRLVVLDGEKIAGWAVLSRVNMRWCYRGVAEVSIYVGEQFRGKGFGYHLLNALCQEAEKAGVEDVHPHRFRRTVATYLIDRGMPIQDVAVILGHSNINTTMAYVYSNIENVKTAYKKYAI